MAEIRYRRSRGNRENTQAANYLDVTGKITLSELYDLVSEYEIPTDGEVNITVVMWRSKPTPDEVVRWEEADSHHRERAERWKRETYQRLKREFEGDG